MTNESNARPHPMSMKANSVSGRSAGETHVIVSELLESPHPYCIIPPRFFDRMLARLDEKERDSLMERGREIRRIRV